MSKHACHPTAIDGFKFSETGGSAEGEVGLSSFARLKDLLNNDAGTVRYKLLGMRDLLGRPALRVMVNGVLGLTCQRCLEALEFVVATDNALLLARSEAEIARQSDELDGPEWIVSSSRLIVLDLVEDELLLSVPPVPKHEACEVETSGIEGSGVAFMGLRGLLKAERSVN